MDLDPRRLRIFHAVAVRGGVMDAATLLHLTPSAVSQQLARLEHEVGVPLVDRSRRRIALTAAGELLAVRAERIEHELAEARRELAELSGRVSGPLTVAAFPTAIHHLLVPSLQRLTHIHPELRPRIVEREGAGALRELRTGGVDLVIAEEDADDPHPAPHPDGLFADVVADDEYRIVTPADWPAVASVEDLATRPWVAGPADSACGRALRRVGATYGFVPVVAHTCQEFPAVLTLVTAGFGAAIVPTLALVGTPPDTVRNLAVPVAGRRRVVALRRASASGPEPVARALVRELQDTARQRGLPGPPTSVHTGQSGRPAT